MAIPFKVVVDCADPHRLAAFWAVALEYEVEDHSALIKQLLETGAVHEADTRVVADRLAFAQAAAGSARSRPSATSWAVARTAALCRSPLVPSRANSACSASIRSRVADTAASGSPTRRPAHDTHAASTVGRAATSRVSSRARSW